MTAPDARPCPSCAAPMQAHVLPAKYDATVELDFCFACQGIWFDHQENLKLSPAAILTVFRQIHGHHDGARQPLATRLSCPDCRSTLARGFDVVRSGRFITHRCENRHGRFSSFSSFMIEKGFVRQLTKPEIAEIAKLVEVIDCSSCGAPVDLRRQDACSHCRSALSLLDPKAVATALQTYAQAAQSPGDGRPTDLGDAIVALEREWSRAQRESSALSDLQAMRNSPRLDLLGLGLALVSGLLED